MRWSRELVNEAGNEKYRSPRVSLWIVAGDPFKKASAENFVLQGGKKVEDIVGFGGRGDLFPGGKDVRQGIEGSSEETGLGYGGSLIEKGIRDILDQPLSCWRRLRVGVLGMR